MVRNIVERLMSFGLLFETPGDTGGGGGGTGDGKPGGDNNPDHKPGTEGKPTGGQPDAGGRREPAEDPRMAGILADLKKERTARQKYEKDYTTTAAELDRERKRVQALAGVNPKSKEEEDEEGIRQRIAQLYPQLAEFSMDDLKALKSVREELAELKQYRESQGLNHGKKTLDSVASALAAKMGGKLSERQDKRIREAYITAAQNDDKFLARHDANDPTLVDEFVKEWFEDFVEPARRQALSEETSRMRRVPNGGHRTLPGQGEKKIDVNDAKAVEDILVRGFKDRGGQFGR